MPRFLLLAPVLAACEPSEGGFCTEIGCTSTLTLNVVEP